MMNQNNYAEFVRCLSQHIQTLGNYSKHYAAKVVNIVAELNNTLFYNRLNRYDCAKVKYPINETNEKLENVISDFYKDFDKEKFSGEISASKAELRFRLGQLKNFLEQIVMTSSLKKEI